ncbi:hypothetical protein Scep_008144 [Stephania cephalantha]|uniref:Uncharacterized protein n=1 Tax=Stephania cephalantha TaxID=152367 RepID=A0AAP0KDT8_9MAGN
MELSQEKLCPRRQLSWDLFARYEDAFNRFADEIGCFGWAYQWWGGSVLQYSFLFLFILLHGRGNSGEGRKKVQRLL